MGPELQKPFEISLAADSDFDRIIDIQFAAFGVPGEPHHEPYHDLLFPRGNTPEGYVHAIERTLKYMHADPSATFLVAREKSTGTIVAAAKWHVYETKPPDRHIDVDWWEKGEKNTYTESVINSIHCRRSQRTPEGPHLVLGLVFTNPDYSGHGAGSQLVRWGFDRADERGLDVFVESSPAAPKFYQKLGFVVEEHCLFEREGQPMIQCFIMRRSAEKSLQ